jgi:hypothetical protein
MRAAAAEQLLHGTVAGMLPARPAAALLLCSMYNKWRPLLYDRGIASAEMLRLMYFPNLLRPLQTGGQCQVPAR